MTTSSSVPAVQLADRIMLTSVLSSTWAAQACYVIAKLGLADLLAAGPRSAGELAGLAGADTDALYRVLRTAASIDVLAEEDERIFRLTSVGELLRSDSGEPFHDATIVVGETVFELFASLIDRVRDGAPVFKQVYGKPHCDYAAANPAEAGALQELLSPGGPVPAVFDTCDFADVEQVVDLGAGAGELAARVLLAAPEATGIVLTDLARHEYARQLLREQGVANRCEVRVAELPRTVPRADIYLLGGMLWRWDDAAAVANLGAIASTAPTEARLLVFEQILPDGTSFHPGKIDDLVLLVATENGRYRTESEHRRLLEEAGFEVRAIRNPIVDLRADSVIEAVVTA
jgi:O-methyltransferase domain